MERVLVCVAHIQSLYIWEYIEAIACLIHKPYAKQKNMLTDCLRLHFVSTLLSLLLGSVVRLHCLNRAFCFTHSLSLTLFFPYRFIFRNTGIVSKEARIRSIQFNRKNIKRISEFFSVRVSFIRAQKSMLGLFILDIKSLR